MLIMSMDRQGGTVSYVEVADWQVGEKEALRIGSRKLAEYSSEVKNDTD